MIYAVDFDGVLCKSSYPHIIKMNEELIEWLKQLQKEDNQLILWTCRKGKYLEEAVKRCAEYGLIFDAVNENLPSMIELYDGDTRKVFADYYIDDRNYEGLDLSEWSSRT